MVAVKKELSAEGFVATAAFSLAPLTKVDVSVESTLVVLFEPPVIRASVKASGAVGQLNCPYVNPGAGLVLAVVSLA